MSREPCQKYLVTLMRGFPASSIHIVDPNQAVPLSSKTYLRDGVGGAGVGEGGGRRAEGGEGSHNLGGVCDILKSGGASGDGENCGSGELHFGGRVGY